MKFATILCSGLLATLALAAPYKAKEYCEKPDDTLTPASSDKPYSTGKSEPNVKADDNYKPPSKTGTPVSAGKPKSTSKSGGNTKNDDKPPSKTGERKPKSTSKSGGNTKNDDKPPSKTGERKPKSTSKSGGNTKNDDKPPSKTGESKPKSTGKTGGKPKTGDKPPSKTGGTPASTGKPGGSDQPAGTPYGAPANRTSGGSTANGDRAPGFASVGEGTTGGAGGTEVTVTTYEELAAAVAGEAKKIVYVSGPIEKTAPQIKVGSNTSLLGKSSAVIFTGFGLSVNSATNVIIRNIAIKKVTAENGDAITVQSSNYVWIDHVDLSSDRTHDKDFYDGLLDIVNGADLVTVTYSKLYDHWKAVLIGNSDSSGSTDTGKLRVTLGFNHFSNLNTRVPSLRFGEGHIYSNFFEGIGQAVNTRKGAQCLVENNNFAGAEEPIVSVDGEGFAVDKGNTYGYGKNAAPAGTLTTLPYSYEAIDAAGVQAAVVGKAGNTLTL
ncbi:hypothetical protein HYALB_00013798 [Hymenoscyphus albidus]|uniref:Pectate lyase domain-containing protein n=1 Tax=Hymenoscyphus albidus TaxID=595503 RepID=A0A9N9LXR7_9HELO|nr:hypothetical protein HYALB_00013798 [Hymenoscyphus albidus]